MFGLNHEPPLKVERTQKNGEGNPSRIESSAPRKVAVMMGLVIFPLFSRDSCKCPRGESSRVGKVADAIRLVGLFLIGLLAKLRAGKRFFFDARAAFNSNLFLLTGSLGTSERSHPGRMKSLWTLVPSRFPALSGH